MSRWIEHFNAHPFQVTWKSLKENLDKAKVDDETVFTSVMELARLKKVIQYLDDVINAIDPELIPANTWDNFDSQARPCLQHVNSFNINRNIADINQANAHADNLLTYIRPYEIARDKVIHAMRKALKHYANTIDEYAESFREKATNLVNNIQSHTKSSEEIFDAICKVKNQIDELKVELFGANEDDGVRQRIRDLSDQIDSKYKSINEYYNEILIGDENNLSTKKEILQAKEQILQEQTNIENLRTSVSKNISELKTFHVKVFGEKIEEEKHTGGLSNELDKLKEALIKFENEQKEKYLALNAEINSLLPGATSAGLATAYKELKDSFDKPIQHSSNVFYWSIGFLVIASISLTIDTIGGDSWIKFVKFQDWSFVLQELVYKLPFYVPVLWLAFYATKRRSEYQRLQQEYAHKEALAKSYNSYMKQIQDLGEKDLTMQKEFIMKTIDAIAYNASSTLDGKHGDKMPTQELIEKLAAELAKTQVLQKSS